jgi:methylenetetrahydrofolate dehydrogenase (NADP+)/methenyltetrahydrofolate cyclohydrolase
MLRKRKEKEEMYQLIDGKSISNQIKEELKQRTLLLEKQGIHLTLAVVQVGDNTASTIYVRNKKKACDFVGINSITYNLPEETTQEELLSLIDELNHNVDVNGILVQLPLPKQINEQSVISAICPEKDVDGFHPINLGKMVIGEDGFLPCTPAGIIQLLKRSNIEIAGKHCVIVGRSNIVGKPMIHLMLKENATITIAHSKTKNLKEITKQADILIVAIGKPKFIDASYVKEGVVIVDVGINRNEENKICGDVDFESVEPFVSAITPVPGGVGPMTIAMLMDNCLKAALKQ